METIQYKISDNHNKTFFYQGIIAYGTRKSDSKTYLLTTEQIGEIDIDGVNYSGIEIVNAGLKLDITDNDISDNNILVDNFIVIVVVNDSKIGELHDQELNEDRIFDNYDDAMIGFEKFLFN